MKTLCVITLLLLLMQSCSSNEIGNSRDVNPNTIYRGYDISYAEGNDRVRTVCQFRFAGGNGTTLVLNKPAILSLDGDSLYLDSTVFDGAYYYKESKVEEFEGKHNLVYADVTGKTYPQSFTFTRVKMDGLPAETTATDILVNFKGLKDGCAIHVNLTDTSSATEDLGTVDTIISGQLTIKASLLAKLKAGPVNVSLYMDEDRPLENPTQQGGYMRLHYAFKPRTMLLKKKEF